MLRAVLLAVTVAVAAALMTPGGASAATVACSGNHSVCNGTSVQDRMSGSAGYDVVTYDATNTFVRPAGG